MKKNAIYAMSFAAILAGMTSCSNNTPNSKDDGVDSAKKMNAAMNDSTPANNTAAAPASKDDADFAVMAANAGMTEIELSKVVLAGTTNPDIKKYAQMIVDEHTAAASKLSTIAASKQITLPASLSDASQKDVDNLGKKKGKDLDKSYMGMMVDDHKKAVDAFQKENDNTKDADLKNFAMETLPTLQKHLDAAKSMKDNMK
jgi:putative membrane protein